MFRKCSLLIYHCRKLASPVILPGVPEGLISPVILPGVLEGSASPVILPGVPEGLTATLYQGNPDMKLFL